MKYPLAAALLLAACDSSGVLVEFDPSRAYTEVRITDQNAQDPVYTPQWGCYTSYGDIRKMAPKNCASWVNYVRRISAWMNRGQVEMKCTGFPLLGSVKLTGTKSTLELTPGGHTRNEEKQRITAVLMPEIGTGDALLLPNEMIAKCEFWVTNDLFGTTIKELTIEYSQPAYSKKNWELSVTPNVIDLETSTGNWQANTTVYSTHDADARMIVASDRPIRVNGGDGWTDSGNRHEFRLNNRGGGSRLRLDISGEVTTVRVTSYNVHLTIEPV